MVNEAGDVLTLADGAWVPAKVMHDPDSGSRIVLDDGEWKPLPKAEAKAEAPRAPDTSYMTPEQMYGGGSAPASTPPAVEAGNSVADWLRSAYDKAHAAVSSTISSLPMGEVPTDAPFSNRPATKIAKAMANAYEETRPVLTDEAQRRIDAATNGSPASWLVNKAAQGLGVGIGAARAGMTGLMEIPMNMLGEKGGRDALAGLNSMSGLLHEIPMVPGPRTMEWDTALRDANPMNWRAFEGAGGEPPLTAPYKPVTVSEVMADNPGMPVDAAFAEVSRRNRAGFSKAVEEPTVQPQSLDDWRAENAETPESRAVTVMNANSVDEAIAKAREAAGLHPESDAVPGQTPPPAPREAPLQPETPVTLAEVIERERAIGNNITTDQAYQMVREENEAAALKPIHNRILDLLTEDERLAANRPEQIPPTTHVDPVTGEATPVKAPAPEATLAGEPPAPAPEPFGAPVTEDPSLPLVPGSLGAAGTPNKAAEMDFATMKANRRRAELDELRELPTPGDKNIYVEGSFPTLAEQSADPVVSQIENMLRERRANHFIGDGKVITEANKARVRALDNEGIPDTTLDGMRKERAAEWETLSKDIIPKSKPANLTAYERWLDGELADPRIRERDAVFSVLKDLKRRLYDENGNLKSDPASVWGLHDQLQDMLKKAKDPLNKTSVEAYADKEILLAKKQVDAAMNVASGNQFQRALEAYAKRSQEIRAGEIMNELRDKAVNMHGEILPQKFHSQVLSLAKDRGDPGIDPSMDITDKGMRTLLDIDKDLKRAGLIKMGAPRQSQTNLMGYLSDKLGAEVAKKFVGAIPVVGKSAKEFFNVLDEMNLDKLAREHTAEPKGGYTRRPTTED